MKSAFLMLTALMLFSLIALGAGDAPQTVSTTANPLDPLSSIAGRMKNGICVGHFDHDQDKEAVAAVNAEYLDSVKSAGFKSIRFFYTTDKTPAFYAANVSYALKNGLVVNLCMFAWEYNTKTKETFAGHWKAIAEYYKDYPDALVFEMFNEPALSPKLKNDPAVMEWVDAGIAAIRAVSPQRIVLVGGPQFMQAEFLVKYVTPDFLTYKLPDGTGFAQDKYIMGACHIYEPWLYTMPKGKRVTLNDLPDWKNQVIGKLDLAAEWAKKWNKPVVVTEWASQSAPKERPDFLAYTQFVVAEMSKRGLGWTYYCGIPSSFLGEDMLWSILDTESGWDQDVLDILTGVKAPPAPAFNLIRNSEFVPGFTALGGWGLSAWGTSSNAAVSLVQNASLSGQHALKITLDGQPVSVFQDVATIRIEKDHASQTPGIRLRNGSTYSLTFIARAESPGAAVALQLENATDNRQPFFTSTPFALNRQAQEYSCQYVHAGDDVPNARLRLLFSGAKTTGFVDKVMMKSLRVKPWTLAERNGRQCLLTPEGKPFMMLGISHVGGALGRNAGEDRNARLAQIEGDLRSWRFNTVPSPEFWDRFPFIVPIDRMVGKGGLSENDPASRFEDVFDPAFKARLRKQVATLCAKTRDNPNCIGYWWSDIPPWPLEGAKKKYGKHWVDVIRDLPDTAPGKKRYAEFMAAPGPHDDHAFLRLIARELYSESAAAFKEHDPQRLIFGERYNGFNTPTEVLEEAARYVDVVSVQPYEGTFGAEKFDALHELTGKPILISDWNVSFKTEARPVTMWPQFPTQAAAAEAYEKYLRDAFAKPYILGYFKCQYWDQVLPTGMLKQGLRQADGKPYEEFVGLLTKIHQRLIEQLEKEGRLARWQKAFPEYASMSQPQTPTAGVRKAATEQVAPTAVPTRAHSGNSGETVTDIDGNVYHTVRIGDQVWLKEDLKTTRFNDGTAIPYVTSDAEWGAINTPAYCWYDHDIRHKNDYGALYNFWAASSGKLAPKGWHVPSADEWRTLVEFVRKEPGGNQPGSRLRERGLDHWIIQNWNATDDYGFSLRGGGYRLWTGYGFDDFGTYYNAFSTTPNPSLSHSAWIFSTYSLDSGAGVYPDRKHNGFSIRCIRGEPLPARDVQQSAMSDIKGAGAFTAPANMVSIPPGKFLMGSPKNEADRYPDESPQMEVTISQGFWMAKYEVAQAEYLALMGTNPSHFTGDTNRPVDSVSWSDATNFCARLTQRERAAGRIPASLAYRLPTEAEWEYACRAGTTTRFHYGDDPGYTNLTHYAWYRQNAGFTTHPVGQKRPNPWGLYDMLGNVWEWCQDWYGAYPGGSVVDPQGPAKPGMNKQRAMRGGDYFNPAQHCRSALRGYDFIPKHAWPPDFGFRVVLAASQPSAETAAAPAQSAEKNAPSGQRGKGGGGTVQERFDQMAATLGLSDEQKNKLMELQRAQYQQMLSGQSDQTPQQPMEQFKKFRAELEQKVKESKILTDEQFAKWKEFQSQRFTGGGKTSGAGTMPKRTSPAPEKPAQPEAQKPKPAVAPASVTPPASVKPVANMVWIQPGTFTQGTAKGADAEAYPDESPPREVTISKGFWMGKFEVTQKEYLAIMGANCSFFDGTPRTSKRSGKTFDFGGPNLERPVDSVSWSNAVRYCTLLTERERAAGHIPPTWAYRLPTEAEWDYAIRAGTTTRYHFGDDLDHTLIKQYEWVGVNKRGQDPNTGTAPTQPVGQLKPNPWGLYDMGGNVWEWVWDLYAQFPRSGNAVVDPLGTEPNLQTKHALKGCGANSPPRWARSAARGYDPLDNKGALHELDLPHTNNYTDHWLPTGFRIVLSERLFDQ